MGTLDIKTPQWSIPLLAPKRYKGAVGGRSSGKSHFFAENIVDEHIRFPNLQTVCIREVQRTLKHSAKKLIEQKIRSLGVKHKFVITDREIRRKGHSGIIIFEGMQNHTADSIKSLEGFDRAWVEEAQNFSARSMELLLPTIRQPGSELWFSWNPEQPTDAVELLFAEMTEEMATLVRVNYTDNPWCPQEMIDLANWQKSVDPEKYQHIWLGGFNVKSEAQVLAGKWTIEDFNVQNYWDGPYFGADWGFSADPTALIKSHIHKSATKNTLYINSELFEHGVETVDLPGMFDQMAGANSHVIRADNARPEIISHMQSHGYPKLIAASKWPGSIEDGISYLRGFDIIKIHPRCKNIIDEARMWSYKVDKQTGDVLPILLDKHNHGFDALRYSHDPMIKRGGGGVFNAKGDAEKPITTYKLLNGQWVVGDGELQVWEEPVRQYIVGAVFAQSGAGVSAIQIIDHHQKQQAAYWCGKVTAEEFAAMIVSLCRRYVNAWAVIDTGEQGIVVLNTVRKSHRRVYSEIPPGAKTGSPARTRKFGFDGKRYMPMLLTQLSADHDISQSGIKSAETLEELENFVLNHDNQVEIIPGCSHERVLAYCLARHGAVTLPKPASNNSPAIQPQSNSGGWAGHV